MRFSTEKDRKGIGRLYTKSSGHMSAIFVLGKVQSGSMGDLVARTTSGAIGRRCMGLINKIWKDTELSDIYKF